MQVNTLTRLKPITIFLRLTPDRATIVAGKRDLSYVTVRIEDKDGNLCPRAENLVRFKVTGAGSIAAVGNGTPPPPNRLSPASAKRSAECAC